MSTCQLAATAPRRLLESLLTPLFPAQLLQISPDCTGAVHRGSAWQSPMGSCMGHSIQQEVILVMKYVEPCDCAFVLPVSS